MDNTDKFLQSLALDPDGLSQQFLGFSAFLNVLLASVMGFLVLGIYLASSPRASRDKNLYMVIPVLSVLMAVIMRIDGSMIGSFFAIFGIMSMIRFRSNLTDQKGITFILFSVIVGLIVGLNAYLLAAVAWVLVSGAILIGRYLLNRSEDYKLSLRIDGPLPKDLSREVAGWFASRGIPANSIGLKLTDDYSEKGASWKEGCKATFALFPRDEEELLGAMPDFIALMRERKIEVELDSRD
jgi:hypothetical protein